MDILARLCLSLFNDLPRAEHGELLMLISSGLRYTFCCGGCGEFGRSLRLLWIRYDESVTAVFSRACRRWSHLVRAFIVTDRLEYDVLCAGLPVGHVSDVDLLADLLDLVGRGHTSWTLVCTEQLVGYHDRRLVATGASLTSLYSENVTTIIVSISCHR